MRCGMLALVGAVMLSWSGTSLAAGLADRALDFEGSLVPVDVASPGLSLPLASHLYLMPAGGEGAVQQYDSGRAVLAVLLALFIGFGSGHFVIGDAAAWMFLGIDIGVIVGAVVLFNVAVYLFWSNTFPYLLLFLGPVLVLGAIAVKIWEVVDVLFKLESAGGPRPKEGEVIVPRTGELARSTFLPTMANGLNLRF